MATPQALHLQAQQLFQLAEFGDLAPAQRQTKLQEAYALETQAAALLSERVDAEPTRSVVYRSAASLAIRCGLREDAQRLASQGLAGEPPEDIRKELLDLINSATPGKGGT